MTHLFVVVLRYLVPLEEIDPHRPAHLEFLDYYYAQGLFLASGRQIPTTGGIILSRAPGRLALWKILKEDPFYTQGLAEYQVFEFDPNRASPLLEDLMKELKTHG